VCSARPYLEKGETSERVEPSLLARRVYLMNLPYDAHHKEIEKLCSEFTPIDNVVLPRDPNGLARGYAFVFVKKAEHV
jgi:RNA recognition motif-containing protein|tara:strand:- start:676 stop:909 length:234 start_codon:yes stop_codon:yes gene_type:complete